MWDGGAFNAAFLAATDAAKKSVAAISTGAQKLGAAAAHDIDVAKDKGIDAAQWAAKETKAAAQWVDQKGREAVEQARLAAHAAGQVLKRTTVTFASGIRSAAAWLPCRASASIGQQVTQRPPKQPN
jgi:hypothetical protein